MLKRSISAGVLTLVCYAAFGSPLGSNINGDDVTTGAEAYCSGSGQISTSEASCGGPSDFIRASASLPLGELKTYTEGDGSTFNSDTIAAFVDQVTVTGFTSQVTEVTGRFEIVLDGSMALTNGFEAFATILTTVWYDEADAPPCLDDADGCGFFGTDRPRGEVFMDLSSGSEFEAFGFNAGTGNFEILSASEDDIVVKAWVDFTVTQEAPSFFLAGVLGAYLTGTGGLIDFSSTAAASIDLPSGFGYTSTNGFGTEIEPVNTCPDGSLLALPETNGGGQARDLAVVLDAVAAPRNTVQVRDGDGTLVQSLAFFDDNWDFVCATAVDDFTGLMAEGVFADSPEIALLALGPTGEIVAQVRDAASGIFVKNVFFLDDSWEPVDLVTVPDVTGNDAAELAVLARNRTTDETVVQIRDSATGAFVRNVFFLNGAWTPRELVVISGFDANPGPELGVLAVSDTGSIVVQVKDAKTNTFAKNVFFLNASWEPIDVLAFDDLPGQSAPTLALLARNKSGGPIVTMMKDASTNGFISNAFFLSSDWTPLSLAKIGNLDGNAGPEFAVMGVANSGKLAIQIKDASSNTFIRNLFPLGSNWQPIQTQDLGDTDGNGANDFGVLARRKSDGVAVIQILGAEGTRSDNVFLP